jgi:hypothetical protein
MESNGEIFARPLRLLLMKYSSKRLTFIQNRGKDIITGS